MESGDEVTWVAAKKQVTNVEDYHSEASIASGLGDWTGHKSISTTPNCFIIT